MTEQNDAGLLSRSGTRNRLEEALRKDKQLNRTDPNLEPFPLPAGASQFARTVRLQKKGSKIPVEAKIEASPFATLAEELEYILTNIDKAVDPPKEGRDEDDSEDGHAAMEEEVYGKYNGILKAYLEAMQSRGNQGKTEKDSVPDPMHKEEPGRFKMDLGTQQLKAKGKDKGLAPTWSSDATDMVFQKPRLKTMFTEELSAKFTDVFKTAMQGFKQVDDQEGEEEHTALSAPVWEYCPGPVLDSELEDSEWKKRERPVESRQGEFSYSTFNKRMAEYHKQLGSQVQLTARQAFRRNTVWHILVAKCKVLKKTYPFLKNDCINQWMQVEDIIRTNVPLKEVLQRLMEISRPGELQSSRDIEIMEGDVKTDFIQRFLEAKRVARDDLEAAASGKVVPRRTKEEAPLPVADLALLLGKKGKDAQAKAASLQLQKAVSIGEGIWKRQMARSEAGGFSQKTKAVARRARSRIKEEGSSSSSTCPASFGEKATVKYAKERCTAGWKNSRNRVPVDAMDVCADSVEAFLKDKMKAAQEIVDLASSTSRPPKRERVKEAVASVVTVSKGIRRRKSATGGFYRQEVTAATEASRSELFAASMSKGEPAFRSKAAEKYDLSSQKSAGPILWGKMLGWKTPSMVLSDSGSKETFGNKLSMQKAKKPFTLPSARWISTKVAFVEQLEAKPKAYLDASSEVYDMSVQKDLLAKAERQNKHLYSSKRALENAADTWSSWEEELVRLARGNGQVIRDITRNLSEEEEAAAEQKEEVQTVLGVRLRDLQELIERNRSWFEETRWCKFSQKMRTKTMYDVCPELIIPATTCMERIVTLVEGDMPRLKSFVNGGVFSSEADLTLKDKCTLGGQTLPAGLTLHGKLVRGGPVRQRYWQKGSDRYLQWRTMECHGRESVPLKDVAPIPKELQNVLDSPRAEPLGEASDRVWSPAELKAGDTVVLRKGVSYIQMCARDGPGFPLDSFASHFWGEETLHFVKTLEKHAGSLVKPGEAASDRVYYVCTFNNNQHRVELGSSWKTSPFNRALQFVATMAQQDIRRARDAVMVFDSEAKPLQRKWCVFEAWRCTELELPLRLFCPDGEITRNSTSHTAKVVLQMVQEIDLETAQCSVKSDAVMIDRAIEDAKGGFAAVHAKLRTRVLDLMTFIGSLAVSVDQVTGKKVEEIELKVRGCAPPAVNGVMMQTNDIAREMCKVDGGTLGRNVLLVAPAGSGKSVFSRALVRYAVSLSKESGGSEVLPVRVPVAELAKIVKRSKLDMKLEVKRLANLRAENSINSMQYNLLHNDAERKYNQELSNLFDVWAKQSFLRDSDSVTVEGPKALLLILDGFDEAAEARSEIITWLRQYLQKRKKLMTLLTTRPTGLEGACMSSGKVRSTGCNGKVLHVDIDENQAVLSGTELPVGTYIKLTALEPQECVVLSHEQRLPVAALPQKEPLLLLHDGKGLGGRSSPTIVSELDQVLCLKPGVYERLNLVQTPPRIGMGAVVTITVKEENQVRREIRDGDKGSGYSMTAADVITITISQPGHNYTLDSDARILGGEIPLLMTDKQAAEYTKMLEDESRYEELELDDGAKSFWGTSTEQRKAFEEVAKIWKIGSDGKIRGKSKVDELKKFRQRLQLYTRRVQQFKSSKSVDPSQWGLHFEVKELARYTTFTTELGREDKKIDFRVSGKRWQDAKYHEIQIREELRAELSFCDFEIDQIEKTAASAIIRNVGGTALAQFTAETLNNFQQDLWDRPLMANLFGQYLESKGLAFAQTLAASVAELYVLRYITQKLIRQAAVVVAPTSKADAIDKMGKIITKGLRTVCRHRTNIGERHFNKDHITADLKLWEDAVRGHLRLFEPQESGKSVQFYHLRIQELLAAEDWGGGSEGSSGTEVSLERAATQMVTKKGLVQLGLAPLKFLTQMKLDQEGGSEDLHLDFSSVPRANVNLVTRLENWMPGAINSLVMRLPELVKDNNKACVLPAKEFGRALPSTLREMELDMSKCKLDEDGFDSISIEWREKFLKLQKLEVNAKNCAAVQSQSVAMFARNLPRQLKELNLDLGHSKVCFGDMFPKFAEALPPLLETLCLDIYGCTVTDNQLREFGVQLPRELQQLDLAMRECPMSAQGILEFCSQLPKSLKCFYFDFRFSQNTVHEGGLTTLAQNLPSGLEELHLTCNRNTSDRDVKGISQGLPDGLESLHLDFRRDQYITDVGLADLGKQLPKNLLDLNLKFPLCMQITGAGVQKLCGALPTNLKFLTLHFDACRGITDLALVALAKIFPKHLEGFDLDVSGCKGITDAGIEAIADLPESLKRLRVNMEGCEDIKPAPVVVIGSKLPSKLEVLSFNCRRCDHMNDDAMEGLVGGLRGTIKQVELDFAETLAGDRGIIALANHLTYGLESLKLIMKKCGKGVSNTGVNTLLSKLRMPWKTLELNFDRCFQVTSATLEKALELRKKGNYTRDMKVDYMERSIESNLRAAEEDGDFFATPRRSPRFETPRDRSKGQPEAEREAPAEVIP